jgi:hypothetical protein
VLDFGDELSSGFHWPGSPGAVTLPRALGIFLSLAEQQFGKRDYSFTILGVEIANADYPEVRYPGGLLHVVVSLSRECQTDVNRALFQLAHEAVHLLSPPTRETVTVLEEGLATAFANDISAQLKLNYHTSSAVNYVQAMQAARKLLAMDSQVIKKLREQSPKISDISAEDIRRAVPGLNLGLCKLLERRFNTWSDELAERTKA